MDDLILQNKEQLENYIKFLLEYNNKINLIGKSTIEDIWNRHIIDSLQLINIIKNKDIRVADLGSGAGLPGIPLSIVGIKEIHLFEKSIRKCEFLEKAKNFSKNKIKNFSKNKIIVRNENLYNVKDKTFDIIVSRALANINLLLEFSQNLSNKNTKLIFLKGKKIYEEIDEAKKYWKFNYELIDSITSSEGKIIIINHFKKLDLF